jgi:oligopeptide transport system ATP-binding protein
MGAVKVTGENYLIEVKDLKMYFPVLVGLLHHKIGDVRAVDNVSFNIKRGETLGLVGESGCGKTTTGRCVIRLNEPTSGKIYFDGKEITRISREAMRHRRRDMQLIFQDPYASLDPRMTAGDIIGEPLLAHQLFKGKAYRDEINELLKMVELEPRMAGRYPHEFSGGQRQRIGIARALAVKPKFIVCDEPISALDVSIQAQVIRLLMKLKNDLNLTYLFIAHDLSVVRCISDRVAVMYLGKIVEITLSDQLYDNPLHPYTNALLSAVPIPNPAVDRQRKRIILTGDVPSPINPPDGCHFHPRCHLVEEICIREEPVLRDIGGEHWVSCHKVDVMRT